MAKSRNLAKLIAPRWQKKKGIILGHMTGARHEAPNLGFESKVSRAV